MFHVERVCRCQCSASVSALILTLRRRDHGRPGGICLGIFIMLIERRAIGSRDRGLRVTRPSAIPFGPPGEEPSMPRRLVSEAGGKLMIKIKRFRFAGGA